MALPSAGIFSTSSVVEAAATGMQQMVCASFREDFHQLILVLFPQFVSLLLALLACAGAQRVPAVLPPAVASFAPATHFNAAAPVAFASFTAPFVAAPAPLAAASPLPLAISSSQRLDYFNHINAAFAPQRLVATPAGLAALPAYYGQPARLLAAATNAAPFFF